MTRVLVCLTLFSLTTATVSADIPAAPANVSEAVGVKELVAAVQTKVKALSKSVADEASFARARESKTVAKDGGVIACLAQAIVEHKDGKSTGINATGLRDAAIVLSKARKLEAATAALKNVNEAIAGNGAKGEKKHGWNKLINMHRMMEEFEFQGGKLRRVLNKPRRLERSSENAAVLVVLGLAMEADTHEVKDKTKLPQWKSWSKEYHQAMSAMNVAIKAGDAAKAKTIFDTTTGRCDICHEVFRD